MAFPFVSLRVLLARVQAIKLRARNGPFGEIGIIVAGAASLS
jgi:hypothetical protein